MKSKFICKKCGNTENFIIVHETEKKPIKWYIKTIINLICAALFIWSATLIKNNISYIFGLIAIAIIWSIIVTIIKKIEKQRERANNTKVICNECGNIFFID